MKLFWKLFLAGISAMFGSCDNDYIAYTEYLFINNTSSKIDAICYYKYDYVSTFDIKAGDTMVYVVPEPWSTDKHLKPYSDNSMIFPPGIIGDDSTKIVFDTDTITFVYGKNACIAPNNLYCKNNYSYERLGDRDFRYIFMFNY